MNILNLKIGQKVIISNIRSVDCELEEGLYYLSNIHSNGDLSLSKQPDLSGAARMWFFSVECDAEYIEVISPSILTASTPRGVFLVVGTDSDYDSLEVSKIFISNTCHVACPSNSASSSKANEAKKWYRNTQSISFVLNGKGEVVYQDSELAVRAS